VQGRLVAIALAFTLASPALASAPAERRLSFDVFLDERPIGHQHFALRPTRDGLQVEIQAALEVKVLRITAFEYDHSNVERWRDGCLQSIEARTNSNGTPYRVTGSALAKGFVVSSNSGEQRLMECVGSFSYWDKAQLLARTRLLNSQTGEYLAVAMRPLGAGRLKLGDRELAVERYALRGKDLEITLAYTVDSGEWVALDSKLSSGRVLQYRRNAAEVSGIASVAAGLPLGAAASR
jgi:hypothetical protein